MGVLITNSVATSIGEDKTNLWGTVVFNTQELLLTGKVQCELSFYKSEADYDAGLDKIYPVIDGNKITNCTIQILITDVIKASGESTMQDVVVFFYTKVITYLQSTYGWTVTIQ